MLAPAQLEQLVTAEELLELPADQRFELVRGEPVEMSPPPGYEHGSTTMRMALRIANHVLQYNLGEVLAAETGVRLARNPDTVLAADEAFVSKDRLPGQMPMGYLDLAPDLVAEVVAPGDDPDSIQAKVADWLAAGTRLVMVVYPRSRQVAVCRSLREDTILTEADTFIAPDTLPEFSLALASIFA
jgi:Uma2 family endonuclease